MELGVSGQSHFGGLGFQISDLGVRGCEGLGEAGDMSNSAPQDSDFLGRAKVCRCPTFPQALVCTVLTVVGGESGCAAADFTHRNTHAHIQTHTHTAPWFCDPPSLVTHRRLHTSAPRRRRGLALGRHPAGRVNGGVRSGSGGPGCLTFSDSGNKSY